MKRNSCEKIEWQKKCYTLDEMETVIRHLSVDCVGWNRFISPPLLSNKLAVQILKFTTSPLLKREPFVGVKLATVKIHLNCKIKRKVN